MPATAIRVVILALAVAEAAKKQDGGGCTAKAVWPDGTELTRECIVEGERSGGGASGAERIGKQFAVLKDTRWHWNNWRDVVLRADGSFLAPAENCERAGNPKCKWYTSGQQIFIKFGDAGVHVLEVDDDLTTLVGHRESDGDAVYAQRRA